jgi:hypothetical protein
VLQLGNIEINIACFHLEFPQKNPSIFLLSYALDHDFIQKHLKFFLGKARDWSIFWRSILVSISADFQCQLNFDIQLLLFNILSSFVVVFLEKFLFVQHNGEKRRIATKYVNKFVGQAIWEDLCIALCKVGVVAINVDKYQSGQLTLCKDLWYQISPNIE